MTTTPARTLPVLWGSNPTRLYVFGHEFGASHVILADSMEEAWEEWADTQEPCDHGNDPEVLAAIAATGEATGCDCRQRENGEFVWDVYQWARSFGPLEQYLGTTLAAVEPR